MTFEKHTERNHFTDKNGYVYETCHRCDGATVVEPDGEACACVKIGKFPGYQRVLFEETPDKPEAALVGLTNGMFGARPLYAVELTKEEYHQLRHNTITRDTCPRALAPPDWLIVMSIEVGRELKYRIHTTDPNYFGWRRESCATG